VKSRKESGGGWKGVKEKGLRIKELEITENVMFSKF